MTTAIKNIPVNPKIPFETLKGLILRANSNERLLIADEWLRKNEVISIPEYRKLREIWTEQGDTYGTFRIILTSGSVKHQYASGLTLKEAQQVCNDSNWGLENGIVWDMEIEQEF